MSTFADHLLRSRVTRLVGGLIGIALLVAAGLVIARNQEVLATARAAITDPHPGIIACLLGLILLNIALSALFFHLLMGRFGAIPRGEMFAIIAATTLLNYLPLRPGLFGRVAYHKTAHDIRVRDTARTVIESLVITASLAGYLALSAWVSGTLAAGNTQVLWTLTLAPLPVLVVAAWCGSIARRPLLLAAAVRHLELLLWAARYILAFRLLGETIEPTAGIAFACAGVISMMVPFISNGLGLREWAIGLLAPWLVGIPLEMGLAAELVNRAAELIVVIPTGLIGVTILVRQHRKRVAETAATTNASVH